jgi:glycine cleavage system H protein
MPLYFTKEHEWLRTEGESALIGITAHAAEQLGDIVFVEVGAVGTRIEQGKELGTVESVKAASEIFAPVDGEITEVNGALADNPALLNESPEAAAWLCRVKLADPAQLDGLMDEAAYRAYIAD